MEHTSDIVSDGKLLHETSYLQRTAKHTEMELSVEWQGVILVGKIDFYNAVDRVIHETKRGKTIEDAHTLQLQFYCWLLEIQGIEGVTGILEYPKLRKKDKVLLTRDDRKELETIVLQIRSLFIKEDCPPSIEAAICKKCSYYELCYVSESDL